MPRPEDDNPDQVDSLASEIPASKPLAEIPRPYLESFDLPPDKVVIIDGDIILAYDRPGASGFLDIARELTVPVVWESRAQAGTVLPKPLSAGELQGKQGIFRSIPVHLTPGLGAVYIGERYMVGFEESAERDGSLTFTLESTHPIVASLNRRPPVSTSEALAKLKEAQRRQ